MIHEIGEIFHRTKQMALDLTKLTASVQAIETTLTALKAEIATLKGNPVTDPAFHETKRNVFDFQDFHRLPNRILIALRSCFSGTVTAVWPT